MYRSSPEQSRNRSIRASRSIELRGSRPADATAPRRLASTRRFGTGFRVRQLKVCTDARDDGDTSLEASDIRPQFLPESLDHREATRRTHRKAISFMPTYQPLSRLSVSSLLIVVSMVVSGFTIGASAKDLTATAPTPPPNLSAVEMLSATDGWLVGQSGTIRRWNGSDWTTVASPATDWLSAIAFTSPNNGWIGGNSGTLLHWDGASWTPVASPATCNIQSIDMLNASDGWGVCSTVGGITETILRWNGSQWLIESARPGNSLYDVDMLSGTNGWAVGAYGTILRWNGTTWTSVQSPVAHDLYAIHMLAPDDGWAVGGDWFSFKSSILHWDGLSWTVAAEIDAILFDIDFVSQSDGWASGHGRSLFHWDGAEWTVIAAPLQLPSLFGIAMVSASDGWAVGVEDTVLRWDGLGWTSFPSRGNRVHVPLILRN